MKEISSISNPSVRRVVSYIERSRNRNRDGVFVVEGIRENSRALKSGYELLELYFDHTLVEGHVLEGMLESPLNKSRIVSCAPAVFGQMAFRKGVPNTVGVYLQRPLELTMPDFKPEQLVLVVEGVEKPGNLGAVLRTANAAGISIVLVCDAVTDMHHPHVIRNSLGAFFDLQIISCSSQDAINVLKENNYVVLATYPEDGIPHYDAQLTGHVAVVMGAEDHGISNLWLEAAAQRIRIPMGGIVDSLNVSAATAVILFEAARQRSDQEGHRAVG